jgi:hypothetical protein
MQFKNARFVPGSHMVSVVNATICVFGSRRLGRSAAAAEFQICFSTIGSQPTPRIGWVGSVFAGESF